MKWLKLLEFSSLIYRWIPILTIFYIDLLTIEFDS